MHPHYIFLDEIDHGVWYVPGSRDGHAKQDNTAFSAQLIRDNDGVVTAEQLAPYMNPDQEYKKSDDSIPNESFLLPAVTQFQVCAPFTRKQQLVAMHQSAHTQLEKSSGKGRIMMHVVIQGDVAMQCIFVHVFLSICMQAEILKE
jgi:hypothetical protein